MSLLPAVSFHKYLQDPGLGQAETRIIESKLGLPQVRQGCMYLNYHLLPPRLDTSRKVERETELGLKPKHPAKTDVDTPSGVLTAMSNTYCLRIFSQNVKLA